MRVFVHKYGMEQLANVLKNINKTAGILTQQSKRPLQVNGMAAISKSVKHSCHDKEYNRFKCHFNFD